VRSYGQYCPVARTAELFAERWTPIIIRNLLGGCTTFGELRAGAPGIPKALLADRLSALARAGIVARRCDGSRRVSYALTERGLALKPVCDAMGAWGMQWLELEPADVDPDYVVWATCRLVDPDRLPDERVVIRFDLSAPTGPARYWLLLQRPQPEVCAHHPGGEEDLVVQTSAKTLAQWHLRELTYGQALRRNLLTVTGRPPIARAWASWVRPSPHAQPRRQSPPF
jgi:DNA-binding HxlR family transcriptional regulator